MLHGAPGDVAPPAFGFLREAAAKVVQGALAMALVEGEEEIADEFAEAEVDIDRPGADRHFDGSQGPVLEQVDERAARFFGPFRHWTRGL